MSNPKNRAEELLDELIKDKSPEDLLGNEGLLKQLTKSLIERAMQGEMTHHLDTRRIPRWEITQKFSEWKKVAKSSKEI
ncbi:hypothetical protein, partial [Leptospira mayottensis]